MAKETTPEIPSIIDNDDVLRNINSLDDALAYLDQHGLAVQDVEDFGTGFHVVDKANLVGVPFVVIGHKIVKGDFGPMSVMFAVTKNNDKVILVDGSTGIHEQLVGNEQKGSKGLLAAGLRAPFKIERGLTRSDYTYKDEKGNDIPATTYYLSS